tara:strand:+ start:3493 stop:4338 length:846 start_codon:yes stop_codon:yes gene_type:complete
MKKILILSTLTVTLFAIGSAKDGLRKWTNQEGRVISAELISLVGEKVTLRMTNEREYEVKLSTLSDADSNFARQWQKAKETAASMEEAGIKIGVTTEVIVETAFNQQTPPIQKGIISGWKAGMGEWRIDNGALIGDELAENNHASSLTHRIEATHLIITAEVQLGTAQQIAFACRDTVPPNLHLGRLYITPDKLWIQHMSGIAKTTKAEKLVTKKVRLDPEKWYNVTIEIIGHHYRAKVGKEEIEAIHSRFSDAKGIIALVNKGQGAKYRNVALWHAEPKE